MTINERQTKERMKYGIETQEIVLDGTVVPKLKDAKILEMGYKTNQDTAKRKNNI
ncbi:hypothetical protein [Methanosarcina barkeri]|uniref:Uncharacterized protein n=1 Tax=Methanosarcina barkeri CM1 TaxID=796385 RepID=A0A0G3CCY9_METBA|nr:hypothetical protein [Methanosarcina barkeri]AKJ39861.1 hypothetical protein MCM1_2865 [Methanosarcina barkeri CM1]